MGAKCRTRKSSGGGGGGESPGGIAANERDGARGGVAEEGETRRGERGREKWREWEVRESVRD